MQIKTSLSKKLFVAYSSSLVLFAGRAMGASPGGLQDRKPRGLTAPSMLRTVVALKVWCRLPFGW